MITANTLMDLAEQINPVYKALKENATYTDCTRCDGEGKLWMHMGVKNGVCFKCGGAKKAPKNQAAKAHRKLWRNFESLRYYNKICKISHISSRKEFKEIDAVISKLPNKYTKLLHEAD